MVGSGFSCASTVPFCRARYTSAKAIGVGLAPTARGKSVYSGASGTRIFSPFMSSGRVSALLAVVWRVAVEVVATAAVSPGGFLVPAAALPDTPGASDFLQAAETRQQTGG